MIELLRYQSDDDKEPFTEWLNALRDNPQLATSPLGCADVSDVAGVNLLNDSPQTQMLSVISIVASGLL